MISNAGAAPMPVSRPAVRIGGTASLWRLGSGALPLLVFDAMALLGSVAVNGDHDAHSAAFVVASLIFAAFWGCYRERVTPTLRSETPHLVAATFASAVVTTVLSPAYVRELRTLIPTTVVLLVVGRAGAYRLQGLARARNKLPTIIIGSGQLGCKLADTIVEHPSCGMEVAGIVDGYDEPAFPSNVEVIGHLPDLEQLLDRRGIRNVIIAFGAHRESEMVDVLRTCRRPDLNVFILPRLYELGVGGGASSGDELWGFPLTRVSRGAMPGPSWAAKRLLDVTISAAAILLLLPVLVVTAIGVRLDTGGPVLFKQRRVGQRGRTVNVMKFRSMPVLPDSDTRWKVDDATISWFGRFLRKTSIDELPQLFNVLRGDMSLVGPRPEREHYVSKFSGEIVRYGARHRVPVGLTGWAQVHGLRGDTSIEDRARFDNYYIEHWSVWFDLVILARTLGHVVRTIGGWGHDVKEAVPVATLRNAVAIDLTVNATVSRTQLAD